MKNNYSVATIGIVGAIIIVFSLSAFFLLEIERISLNLWALGFLLLSELVLCIGMIAIRVMDSMHSKVFVRSGISVVLSLYFLLTLFSVLSMILIDYKLNVFILLQLGMISVFAISGVSILAFGRKVQEIDKKAANELQTTEAKRGGF